MEWQYCPSVRISNHFPLSRRNDEKGSPITLLYHFLCRPLLLTTHNLKYYLSRTWYWAWGDIQLPCLLFFKYSEISWLVWPMALQLGNVLAFLSWLAKWVLSCTSPFIKLSPKQRVVVNWELVLECMRVHINFLKIDAQQHFVCIIVMCTQVTKLFATKLSSIIQKIWPFPFLYYTSVG